MAKTNLSDKDIKFLWGRSGNQCAFPDCNVELTRMGKTGSKIIMGVMAHIKGENPTSARYDSNMSGQERDSCDNRILLCPTHHTLIDNDPQVYTVEKLLEMKHNHEQWVKVSRQKEEMGITFAELEVITKFLVASSSRDEGEITVIPMKDKIGRNQISSSIEDLLKVGMLKSKLVEQYIQRQPDIDFGDRLKQGFVDKYSELKTKGMAGDELFLDLFEFASNSTADFKKQAAALAILTYFFETCEVFEK
jgi:hypothetical protein